MCQSSSPSRSSGGQHDQDVVWPGVDRLAQLRPSSRDRLTDLVQHDPVPGGEQLQAGDAGDDVLLGLDRAAREDPLDDADRRVVERRVAPHQEADVAVLLQEHLLVRRRRGPRASRRRRRRSRPARAVPLGVGTSDDRRARPTCRSSSSCGPPAADQRAVLALVGDDEVGDRVSAATASTVTWSGRPIPIPMTRILSSVLQVALDVEVDLLHRGEHLRIRLGPQPAVGRLVSRSTMPRSAQGFDRS